jgi:hypothetical protein
VRPLAEKSANRDPANSSEGAGDPAPTFENLAAALRRHRSPGAGKDCGKDSEDAGSSVETVVEEGVVKKIIVRCRCGEVTEIDCAYDG